MGKISIALMLLLAAAVLIILTAKITVVDSEPAKTEMNKGMTGGMHKGKMMSSEPAVSLRMAMRQLWEEHLVWTRNYIISALAGLEDTSNVANRLLKNQDDIGNAIKPYYGEEAGKKLAALLRDHIMIATEVVGAAKAGKTDELTKAQKKWSANGDEIASFLSTANPNWPKDDCAKMLAKHLEYTTDECVCRLKKDWAGDINAYDRGHEHMLMFADMLSKGIAMQFPDKFKPMVGSHDVMPHAILAAEIGMSALCPVTKSMFKVSKDTEACEYNGEIYYFCCNECPVKFKNEPFKYTNK